MKNQAVILLGFFNLEYFAFLYYNPIGNFYFDKVRWFIMRYNSVKYFAIPLILGSVLLGCEKDNIFQDNKGSQNEIVEKQVPAKKELVKIGSLDENRQLKLPDEYMPPMFMVSSWGEKLYLLQKAKTTRFEDGRVAHAKDGDLIGLISGDGFLILPVEYKSITMIASALLVVKKSDKYGLVDNMGNFILNMEYDKIEGFSETLVRVNKNNKWGIVDTEGKVVLPLEYDGIDELYDGLARVKQNNLYGFIDTNAKIAIPIQYMQAGMFSENLIPVVAKIEYTPQLQFIDKNAQVILTLPYERAGSFQYGLATVMQNKKWGIIDKSGQLVLSLKYDNIRFLSEEFIVVTLNNKKGIITKDEKIIVPFQNEDIGLFSEDLFEVGDKLITTSGKNIAPPNVNFFAKNKDFITLSNNKHKYGLMTTSGKVIIPVIYDYVPQVYNDGKIRVSRNGKDEYYDKNGKLINK